MTSLRNRLRVAAPAPSGGGTPQRLVARVNDLSLIRYAGLLAQRPRCAANLQALLGDFFQLPVEIRQFQGQWLRLDKENQSRLGVEDGACELERNLVLGDRVWEVQSKIRVRLGPLSYEQFLEFLPDRTPAPERKSFFLLSHLTRLFVGPELDFDAQLVLKREETPECQLTGDARGPRLGWNTWLHSQPLEQDPEDATFEGDDACVL